MWIFPQCRPLLQIEERVPFPSTSDQHMYYEGICVPLFWICSCRIPSMCNQTFYDFCQYKGHCHLIYCIECLTTFYTWIIIYCTYEHVNTCWTLQLYVIRWECVCVCLWINNFHWTLKYFLIVIPEDFLFFS